MTVTFFNQPWLERRYRPGTRLLLTGKYQGHRGFRVNEHAETGELVSTGEDMATYPASDGLTSVQIAALAHEHRATARDVLEPLPARLRALAAPARPLGGARRRALRRPGGRPPAAGVRRVPAAADRALPAPLAAPRGARAPRRWSRRATLTARWLRDSLPFTPTGDQRTAMGVIDDDIAGERPMQRLLMGEVGSGKTVVALYAMLRAVESGAQAALMAPTETLAEQHFATLQKLMPGELVQAALLTGSTPAGRRADLLGKLATRRAEAAGRHARDDRGPGRVRPPGGRRRGRAAPLRRQPAPRAGPQGAAGPGAARPAHDRDADPAHARADRLRRPRRDRAARAARRAGGRSRRSSPAPTTSAPAPTSASARSSTPAARRSSSARWSRSPRRCRPRPPPPSSSACAAASSRTTGSC